MESLGKIFSNDHRVKIMRLFLFHESEAFDIDEVVTRSIVKRPDARKELNMLTKIGFLKKKSFTKKVPNKVTKKNPTPGFKRVKTQGWVLDMKFDLVLPLQELLINSELVKEKDIIKRFKKIGKLKFLALSGLFIADENRKVDILIVGDKLKKDQLAKEVLTPNDAAPGERIIMSPFSALSIAIFTAVFIFIVSITRPKRGPKCDLILSVAVPEKRILKLIFLMI